MLSIPYYAKNYTNIYNRHKPIKYGDWMHSVMSAIEHTSWAEKIILIYGAN